MVVALLVSTFAVLLASDEARAAASPIEGNPVFRLLVACLSDSSATSGEQKLDQFFAILERSFQSSQNQIYVRDLGEYLERRNQVYETPGEALAEFKRSGVLTPFSIRTPSTAVLEQIIDFEAKEMRAFVALAQKQLPPTTDVLNLQNSVWNKLLNLYGVAQGFRDFLDVSSSEMIRESFARSERASQDADSGGPFGPISRGASFFSAMMGLGASFARATGENLVNPLVRKVVFGPQAMNEMRGRALSEITNLHHLPPSEKERLAKMFDSAVLDAIQSKIGEVAREPSARDLIAGNPLARAFVTEWLPAYFQEIGVEQRRQLVWAVLNTANFGKLDEKRQFRVVASAMGPLLPYVLHMAAKNPLLKANPLADYFCCDTPVANGAPSKAKVRAALAAHGITVIAVEPKPLATTPLKETYRAQIRDGSDREAKSVIVQLLRPGVNAAFERDREVLKRLRENPKLRDVMSRAGASDLAPILETLSEGVAAEIDFHKTAEAQRRAADVYERSEEIQVGGKRVTVDIRVPKVIATEGSGDQAVLVQEAALGQKWSEVREADRILATAALESFTQMYLREVLQGSGFIWNEPSERNLRVTVEGSRVRLDILNFGGSERLGADEVRSVFAALGRVPFSELGKLARGREVDIETATQVMQDALKAGFQLNLSSLRFAQGMMGLRDLLGDAAFKRQILRLATQHPSSLWSPLGAFLKAKLKTIYEGVKGKVATSGATSSAVASPPSCRLLFSSP